MTEEDWLDCTTRPMAMLRHVQVRTTRRRLRLLACACCRLVWDQITDPRSRNAVALLEQFADGLAGEAEFALAQREAGVVFSEVAVYIDGMAVGGPNTPLAAAVSAAASAVTGDPPLATERCVEWVQECASRAAEAGRRAAAQAAVRARLCDAIREIFGNPFRPWTAVPQWLGSGVVQPDGTTVRLTGTARGLAEGIQADQAFDRLPILADALEEAGITDPGLLAHCRQAAGHVRGCWAVDVVLGKG